LGDGQMPPMPLFIAHLSCTQVRLLSWKTFFLN